MNTESNDLAEKNGSETQQQESRGVEKAYKEKIKQLMEAKVNAEKEKLQKYEEMMEKVNVQLKQMEK